MRDRDVEVLGRGGLIINLMSLGGAAMFLGFTIFTATSAANSLADCLLDASLFGVLTAGFLLMGTTSVRIDGRDIVLVRLLAATSIPVGAISSVSGDYGLEITTADGRVFTHVGYGSSLLGSLTGNRRSTRVARRIWAELPKDLPSAARTGIESRARPGLGLFLLMPAAFVVLASVLHA